MSRNVPITVAHGDGIGPEINGEGLELTMIENRGVKAWPEGISETLLTDAYRCRSYDGAPGYTLSQGQ